MANLIDKLTNDLDCDKEDNEEKSQSIQGSDTDLEQSINNQFNYSTGEGDNPIKKEPESDDKYFSNTAHAKIGDNEFSDDDYEGDENNIANGENEVKHDISDELLSRIDKLIAIQNEPSTESHELKPNTIKKSCLPAKKLTTPKKLKTNYEYEIQNFGIKMKIKRQDTIFFFLE